MSNNDETCPICLNEFNETHNFSITPCNHKFCFNCILQSLQTLYTCPLCRHVLLEADDEDNDSLDINNENTLSFTNIRNKLIFFIKRVYNEGFTPKEFMIIIISLLLYQNYSLSYMNNYIIFLQIMDLNPFLNLNDNLYDRPI